MEYLKTLCKTVSSFWIPRRSAPEGQQTNLPASTTATATTTTTTPDITTPTPATSAAQLYTPSIEGVLGHGSMSPTSKTQDWLSSAQSGQFVEGDFERVRYVKGMRRKRILTSSRNPRTMVITTEKYRRLMQLRTLASGSGLRRKLSFDSHYPRAETQVTDDGGDNLDGDTIVVDEDTPAKRQRLMDNIAFWGTPTSAIQVNKEKTVVEADTLVKQEKELGLDADVETEVEDSEKTDAAPDLNEDLETDAHTGSDASESDDGMVFVSPHQVKAGRGLKTSSAADDVYRPSPEIVDRNLVKDTARADHESDLSEEEIMGKQYAVKKNDRKEVTFDFNMEKARRWADAVKLPNGHWGEAEQDLYFRLAMRGFEPLVPSSWQLDFSTLPESLFSYPGDNAPFIQSDKELEFRAIKALSDLFNLGNQVRDRQFVRLDPEPVMHRSIDNYIKWALQDSNFSNHPNAMPVHAVHTCKPSETTRYAVQTLNSRLVALANRYREAWKSTINTETSFNKNNNDNEGDACTNRDGTHSFPVITGFLICGPIVAVLTLDSNPKAHPVLDSNTTAKFISQFDFGEPGQDVWNALAVAIAVVRMRKTMAQLETDWKEKSTWMVGDLAEDTDPDF
ncbi:hypothetical protein GX48_00638 [Paracoccidioides brasiliensis]|nr:hypothetical protein GX48_00638 [Paracoccidioides brasiliensis]